MHNPWSQTDKELTAEEKAALDDSIIMQHKMKKESAKKEQSDITDFIHCLVAAAHNVVGEYIFDSRNDDDTIAELVMSYVAATIIPPVRAAKALGLSHKAFDDLIRKNWDNIK